MQNPQLHLMTRTSSRNSLSQQIHVQLFGFSKMGRTKIKPRTSLPSTWTVSDEKPVLNPSVLAQTTSSQNLKIDNKAPRGSVECSLATAQGNSNSKPKTYTSFNFVLAELKRSPAAPAAALEYDVWQMLSKWCQHLRECPDTKRSEFRRSETISQSKAKTETLLIGTLRQEAAGYEIHLKPRKRNSACLLYNLYTYSRLCFEVIHTSGLLIVTTFVFNLTLGPAHCVTSPCQGCGKWSGPCTCSLLKA